jgi:hypothetical protein
VLDYQDGEMDLGELAGLAANTLVTAAVTDAWEDARQMVARIFGRGHPDPGAERRLDATRRLLALATSPYDLERAQAAEAVQWQTRLADLMADHPEIEDELRVMVREIGAALSAGSVSASDHSVAAGGDIRIGASGGSLAAGVIHGDAHLPGPTLPGQAGS